MSIEQLKREVLALSDREQADLIRFTLQLRHEHDAEYRREVTDRLNDADKSHWLTPDEFERSFRN
jgi:asparagine synthetase B (glutamine-hydrolysing)